MREADVPIPEPLIWYSKQKGGVGVRGGGTDLFQYSLSITERGGIGAFNG